jgi:hypothetical protein
LHYGIQCITQVIRYKIEELLENLRKYAVAAGVAGDFGWGCAHFNPITDQAVASSKASTGVTVRREKALDFSGCNSRPGTGSLHPVAIEAAVEETKPSEPPV